MSDTSLKTGVSGTAYGQTQAADSLLMNTRLGTQYATQATSMSRGTKLPEMDRGGRILAGEDHTRIGPSTAAKPEKKGSLKLFAIAGGALGVFGIVVLAVLLAGGSEGADQQRAVDAPLPAAVATHNAVVSAASNGESVVGRALTHILGGAAAINVNKLLPKLAQTAGLA